MNSNYSCNENLTKFDNTVTDTDVNKGCVAINKMFRMYFTVIWYVWTVIPCLTV